MAVFGLYGREPQYFVNACEMRRFVSGDRVLPVFACAILSFCVCGISLRYVLFIVFIGFIYVIIVIVVIVLIGFIINIPQVQKMSIPRKNLRAELSGRVWNERGVLGL